MFKAVHFSLMSSHPSLLFPSTASVKILNTPAASPQRAPGKQLTTQEWIRSKSGSPVWQQAATPPSTPSLTDYPPLATRRSRAEEKKTKDLPEGSNMVFRDAHHAQLREVHGANVRALEALEAETKESVDRRKKRLSQDEVNSLAEDAIRDIASEGEHVTVEKVWVFTYLYWNIFLICHWLFEKKNVWFHRW